MSKIIVKSFMPAVKNSLSIIPAQEKGVILLYKGAADFKQFLYCVRSQAI